MRLASRFGRINQIRRDRPLSQVSQCKPDGNGILDGIPKKTSIKKAMLINSMASNSGGTDGTRTRDPLRDRQVF
ncbi:TPA: hypothetical protein JLE21_003969 [Escherichia coli]|nr:hypothetical protein [Escherichia coli]HAW7348606.1 hypothetical protein [Escherichia coli]